VALGSTVIIVVLIAFLAIFGLGTVLGEQVSHLAAALPKGVQIKKLHAASSSDEFQLGSEGVALVCVSYLDVVGAHPPCQQTRPPAAVTRHRARRVVGTKQ
jgi:hypothetical protein